ncbi:hypothetical protein ABPG72_003727 [Tetrahymena utriculariae]
MASKVKANDEEKNIKRLVDQKNSLLLKLDDIKKKIDDKAQRTKRLQEKKDNLLRENNDIQKFYDRIVLRKEKNLLNQLPLANIANEKAEDEDEKEFQLKLEDKIEFNLEQYLTELENSIKRDIKEQSRLMSGENQQNNELSEYQKSNTNAVCIKNIIGMSRKSPSNDDKLGIYYNTFKILKKTKVKELKETALKFWSVQNCQRQEVQDLYELVDLELNPISYEDQEVDAILQKLTEQKLSTLILRKKKIEEKKIIENESKQNDNKEGGENADGSKKKNQNKDKDQQEQQKNKKNDIIKAFDKFFYNLPLLRSYFAFKDQDIVEKTNQDQTKIGLQVDDYSCVALILVVVLYSLTLVSMLSNENLRVSFVNTTKLVYYMDIDNYFDTAFVNVNSFESLTDFLVQSHFSVQLFQTKSILRQNFSVLGAIRMRQVRTRKSKCRVDVQNVQCYYRTYNEQTKEKNPINHGRHEYERYQNTHQSGTLRNIVGQFDTYDSSGYIYDISQNFEYNDYTVSMLQLFQNKVFNDPSIRAIFIQFTLMNEEDGTIIFLELICENTAFGFFSSYSSKIYKSIDSSLTCSLDPKLYINVLFTLFYAYQFIQYGFSYAFSLIGIVNLVIQIFIYLSVSQECFLDSFSLGYTPTEEQFIDVGSQTSNYQLMVMYQSISCGSCLLRLVFFLEFFNSFRKIMQSINHGLFSLYISIVFIFGLLCSFALIYLNMWGQWISSANTFIKALFSLILMMIGCYDYSQITFDGTALIFFVFVFFIFSFFLMSIITVHHIDEYRQIVLLYGDESQNRYTFKDNLRWLIVFLPDKYQKLILEQE